MEENSETNSIKTGKDPITGQFTKGNKLGGRTSGSLDFKTKWHIFIDKVAKQNDMTPEQIDEQLLAVGFKKAKEGDYAFYRDIHDRVYGRPIQPTDITTGGLPLILPSELITKNDTAPNTKNSSDQQEQI